MRQNPTLSKVVANLFQDVYLQDMYIDNTLIFLKAKNQITFPGLLILIRLWCLLLCYLVTFEIIMF